MSDSKNGDDKTTGAAEFDAAKLQELIQRLGAQVVEDTPKNKLEREVEAEKTAVHDFWYTQPVPKSSDVVKKDAPVHPPLPPEKIPQEPYALPDGMVWCTVDIEDDTQLQELHELLLNNYVEDPDATFRFNYPLELLRWVMLPPGFNKSWHVGVRSSESGELIGFISGVPFDIMVRDRTMSMAEINLLCLHKKLRSQRLAPLLIKEVTRRVHLVGIFQAIYTSGRLLPKPVATCRYFHRSLQPRKLVDIGFSAPLDKQQLTRLAATMRLPQETATKGLRLMRKGDVGQVRKLLNRFLKTRYELVPSYTSDAQVAHWLLPREKVLWSYVVEDNDRPGKITDFFSFFSLPSQALKAGSRKKTAGKKTASGLQKKPGNDTLYAAYTYYYATTTGSDVSLTAEEESSCDGAKKKKTLLKEKQDELIKGRLVELFGDALVLAKNAGFDVFNCLDMMDNALFSKELKFGRGDGFLRYYFYNYMARDTASAKVGFVML
ncbi:glycylpeptide N-tetradecanoyltransferase [Coemansia sp. RSA 1813]|nr:glycylpeptide N-tetradecanoyltransferase [Coemansia sp. RSA 1646]KAJ1770885.1 glycylpeptide N-tetradecanoyltransferase [Coemansia sp. RSA 1843]KAJ2092886.1 glycylpeptide N-tetradecanoyltransferase [Coemansia sp. RSA 986]KAJ2216207.1 glycylpeptide N-tetradecanoyltransferase [Coemansia sp. RSA 487]KAJ2570620.1 glycylpeptide N-tetradecanoyltransferase [Coemansia sp. RSA 1813]